MFLLVVQPHHPAIIFVWVHAYPSPNPPQIWFESIKRVGVTNYLVVALDDEIASFCQDHDVPVYRRDATISKSQAGTGANHAISGDPSSIPHNPYHNQSFYFILK